MLTIDRDLVRAINSGRCFAIIGSGPSCQMGVPSWKQLAEKAIDKTRQTKSMPFFFNRIILKNEVLKL